MSLLVWFFFVCKKAKLIIADEAISALDVSIQAQIVNLLKELKITNDLTCLFITHDLSMVKYISDRIGVMCQGWLVEIGTAGEIYNTPCMTIPTPYYRRFQQLTQSQKKFANAFTLKA